LVFDSQVGNFAPAFCGSCEQIFQTEGSAFGQYLVPGTLQSITGIGDTHPRAPVCFPLSECQVNSDDLFSQDTGDAMKVGMESHIDNILTIYLDKLLSLNKDDVFRLHGEVFLRENVLPRRDR
jgi:hypothetical protein